MDLVTSPIQSAFRDGFRPIVRESICEWARKNFKLDLTSPLPGYYRVENSPYMREPLEVWQDDSIREQVSIGPNQGGRTKGMEVGLMWGIINRPGPTQWNTDTDDKAKEFAEERFWPQAVEIPAIVKLFPANLDQKRIGKVIWANGYALTMQGSSESNAQQRTIQAQLNDEVYKWKEGRLSEFHKRTTALAWTRKIWDCSVAGNEGEQLEARWLASSQGEWCHQCPKCGTIQEFKWENVIWEKAKNEHGEYDYGEIIKTVHMRCDNGNCDQKFADTTSSRAAMNGTGRYMHARPERKIRGHRYNYLAVNWSAGSWGDVVIEFLDAMLQFKNYGSTIALQIFITRRLAQFWEEGKFTEKEIKVTESNYKLGKPNIWIQTKWEEDGQTEAVRFLSCDKQEWGYPYVCRAVMQGGASRLVDVGIANNYEDIAKIGAAHGLTEGRRKRILIDCSYDMRDVFQEASRNNWTCFRGSPSEGFTHLVEVTNAAGIREKRRVQRLYSVVKWGDPGFGANKPSDKFIVTQQRENFARVFEWSQLGIKDMVAALRRGAGVPFGVPADVPQRYLDEMAAERRYRRMDFRSRVTYYWSNRGRNGRSTNKPNHSFDCECQIVVASAMQGLLELDNFHGSEPSEERLDNRAEQG